MSLIASAFSIAGIDDYRVPVGYFNADSIKVGQHVRYTFYLDHARNVDVLFPDSSYSYAPFEFVKKDFFKTKELPNGLLRDSVEYTLTTFETEPLALLQLPVFYILDRDTVRMFSKMDTIFFSPVLKSIPNKIELKSDLTWWDIKPLFNYPIAVVASIAGCFVLVILIIVFFKPIRRYIQLYRLKKEFEQYLGQVSSIEVSNKESIEKMLGTWKRYIQQVDQKPVSSMTSKEIEKIYEDQDLTKCLHEIDRYIYAGLDGIDVGRIKAYMTEFMIQRYNNKRERIQHGTV